MNITVQAILCIVAGLFALQVQAKTPSEVFEDASRSVVVVYGLDAKGNKQSQGSGVALPGSGVATNCHVLRDTPNYSVTYRDKTYPAKIRHSDWDRDVCSLSVPGLNAKPATLGATHNLKIGQRVYAIGAPQGLELTLSEGIVSSLREVDSGRYIQTTTPISPGSSGGGLFDDEGRLIGLPAFYLAEGQQLNFALPVEWVKDLPGRHATQARAERSETEWLNRAIAFGEKQDWPAFLRHAQLWIKAQPRSLSAWFNLGVAYAETGQIVDAIEAYQQALRINPQLARTWYNLGNAYWKAGHAKKAIDAFNESLSIDPESADTWYNLGVSYAKTGQTAKAIESFQQALRINPEASDAWYGLGLAYSIDGQHSRVIEVYRRLKALSPELADTFFSKHILP
jgi:tetratricopeptide (TPR) repeat protein